ncbi:pancreas/duodenum homeobox protein 1 [Desulfococcaceae bacterium HSG8]|nr:pancreas/duodenum homeobox protein 1 [Desulfococcaceae bacterium HSG8]
MKKNNFEDIFTPDTLRKLFPEDRSDLFFDAIFGDASEGAYDISLEFKGCTQNRLEFHFCLKQRAGKCLVCNLTYGLPEVFSRHPVINIKGLIQEIDRLLNGLAKCAEWRLDMTHSVSDRLHLIPLFISLEDAEG